MKILQLVKNWAELLKQDVLALWFSLKHPQMPFGAKAIAFFTVAYALSPIDLIPDFIPVLGLLDDLILIPVLMWLTIKLTPSEVLNRSRQQAQEWMISKRAKLKSYIGIFIVVTIWLLMLWLIATCCNPL